MKGLYEKWDGLYERIIPNALERIQQIPGVVVGFHSVVDGISPIAASQVEALLEEAEIGDISLGDLKASPEEIKTPTDFVIGLLYALQAGRSFRMVINEEAAFHWIMDRLKYDRLRLGGTSGCMANALAPLQIPRILVYANPPTRQLMELFGLYDNLWVIVQSAEGKTVLKHPWDAWDDEGIRALHWGFEFQGGMIIQLADGPLHVPRAGRFYACWNPVNNKLQISEAFKSGLFQHIDSFSHMIVAGYQLLSPHYPDGSTCMAYIPDTVNLLKGLKRAKPSLQLHLEMDTIPSRLVRKGVLNLVMPCVDSIGLNEVELDFLVQDLEGIERTTLGGTGNAADYVRGMVATMEKLTIKRIHFHTGGYYLCLQKGGDAPRAREGLFLASAVAACRAQFGEIESLDIMTQLAGVPYSNDGFNQMRALAGDLHLPDAFLDTGLARYGGYELIFVPTRIVTRPAVTVGLGDTISAVGFLAG
jgi:ADP-dependent phosphofructokinase/glucokinase